MIRWYSDKKDQVLEYISLEREMTLFIYGDIEQYGMDKSIVRVFVDLDGDKINSLLIQYRNTKFVIYSRKEDFPLEPIVDFFKDKKMSFVSGKESILKRIIPFYPEFSLEPAYMCVCSKAETSFLKPLAEGTEIRPLKKEETKEAAQLLSSIEEFNVSFEKKGEERIKEAEERIKADMEEGNVPLCLFVNGTLASFCNISAASKQSAMVVSVATRKDFRSLGYASHLVAELCEENFRCGRKFLCLFYDNPQAGKIYRKIGFAEIGLYGVMHRV
jgi:uncharacterized protein